MTGITLLHFLYLHVPLTIQEIESYASLNFEHFWSSKGILPSNRIHVYLLDPCEGSITFYLKYHFIDDYYYLDNADREIDSLILYSLNEAIKNHFDGIRLLLSS